MSKGPAEEIREVTEVFSQGYQTMAGVLSAADCALSSRGPSVTKTSNVRFMGGVSQAVGREQAAGLEKEALASATNSLGR